MRITAVLLLVALGYAQEPGEEKKKERTPAQIALQHMGEGRAAIAAKKIPEVADLDRWEQLSREDPLFTLNVPWLPATWRGRRMTVRRLVERIEKLLGAKEKTLDSSDSLARIVFEGSANGTKA